MKSVSVILRTSSMHFMILLVKDMDKKGENMLLILA